jgi:hypothetical protein
MKMQNKAIRMLGGIMTRLMKGVLGGWVYDAKENCKDDKHRAAQQAEIAARNNLAKSAAMQRLRCTLKGICALSSLRHIWISSPISWQE